MNPGRIPIIVLVFAAIMLSRLVVFAAEEPIVFAGDSDFPPVEYLEKEIPKGLNVDLLRELSKAMGREIDIRLMHWEDAQQKVLRGEIDAITTMAITEKRKELYDFSEVTLKYQYSLFVRTDQVGLQTKEDLVGKAVAVTEGGLPKQVLESIPGIKFVSVEDYLEGFRRLLALEIDAVAADRWVGAYTLEQNGIRGITIREKPFAQKQAGIAVKKGNTQLLDDINLGIRKLIDDGTIQRIEDDWSSKEVLFLTREAVYEKAVYGVAALLLVVSGVAFFWILTLRKANNSLRESRRTALHLKDEALEAHRQTEQALQELHQSRMDLDRAQEVGQIGWWRLDTQRNVLTWSDQSHRIFGVPQGTPLTYETFLGCVHPDDRPVVDTHSKTGLDSEPYEFEHRILVDGQIKWVREKAYAEFDDAGKLLGRFGITQDITARKRSEQERQTTVEFLRLVNQSKSTAELLRKTTDFFFEISGCEAVGIRFRQGDDYPYYETRGFPPQFVVSEKLLCAHDPEGETIRNRNGQAALECMCGLVIDERLDPEQSFYTAKGSFWTNSLTDLLSGNPAQAQLWTRGRCIEEGYESVALIGLRSGEQSLGLLQLNDKRKGRFSIEVITFWERMADYLTVALSKFSAQEALGESEKLYKELVENANSAIIRWRSDGTVTFFNEYAQAFFGYSAKEAIGRHVSFLLPRQEADGADLSGFVQDIVDHPQKYLNTINENICRDGRRVWMAWTNKPIGNHGGQLEILAIGSDVTEQKAAEQALRRFSENLEQQVAERTALAESRARQLQALAVELIEAEERERRRISDLLHEDLQQILASAKLTLQSTRLKDPDLDRVHGLLEESIRKSRHLSHELSPAVLHYSDLGAALAWLIRQMRDQFRLDVRLEMAPDRPLESAPLKVFLFRAVKELLFNIVKHAGVKTAQVKLAGSDNQLFITVSDAGKGFDTAMLETQTPSAGLGLLSLRERASYIGGSLTIESTPGQGSRLTLKVPAHMNAAPPAPLAGLEANLQVPSATVPIDDGPASIRVLFADDHKVMRQGLIRLIAGKANIQVAGEAANGREALELARKLRPDTIVMDISMPEMDGIEATRRITAEFPDIRVIGLSMHEDERAAREMHAAGAEAFVVKTASVAELLKTICGDHKRATHLRPR